MPSFNDIPYYMFLNKPVAKEVRLENLKVHGEIPAEIRGSHYRAVPDPAFEPRFADDTLLSDDGMVSRLDINDEGVNFEIKFVQTARHQAEVAAGKALFGRYRNPFTDLPEVADVDRTVSNTTPVFHAGKLLMAKEDGRPYQVDPKTLETIGRYDFDGALRSDTMTAHVRIDPTSQKMYFYGYEADGLASKTVSYCVVGADGKLISEQFFENKYCAMMHDFLISENYAVFPVFPTTSDLDRLKEGGVHWVHDQQGDSWVGIMPRDGSVDDLRWYKGPKGVHSFHMMNAFEQDGAVHMDVHMFSSNAFEFIRVAGDIHIPQQEVAGSFERWTMPLAEGADEVVIRPMGPPGDMPRIADADMGRPYVNGWYLTVNPEGAPPLLGGPVGALFNMILQVNAQIGQVVGARALPPGHAISELVHIPSQQDGHMGYLMAVVDRQIGEDDYLHETWILDANNINADPVARIEIPHRLRPQVHGWWVSQQALEG
jgi:carotenoid cleavage dioxygenase-like enzyme